MKKKAIIIISIMLFMIMYTTTAFAASQSQDEYFIKRYHVHVVVNDDRSYDVEEFMIVHFNVESRGIYRDIITRNADERFKVENIEVHGEPVKISKKLGYINVRIGDPDETIIGDKSYSISYTRYHYDDNIPELDLFIMNLLDNNWSVPVVSFIATVELPENANMQNVSIISQRLGSTEPWLESEYNMEQLYNLGASFDRPFSMNDYDGDKQIEITFYGNSMSIELLGQLNSYTEVNMRVEMLPGAFPNAKVSLSNQIYNQGEQLIVLVISLIAILICLLAYKNSQKNEIVVLQEYLPPENMDPATMAYYLKGKIARKDIISLIPYWASHGHLSMEIIDDKENFTLTKLSELDESHTPYEMKFFEEIFYIGENDLVSSENLKKYIRGSVTFSTSIDKTISSIKDYFTGEHELEQYKIRPYIFAIIMVIASVIMMYILSKMHDYTYDFTSVGFIVVVMYVLLFAGQFVNYHNKYVHIKSKIILNIIYTLLLLSFGTLIYMTVAGIAMSIGSTLVVITALVAALYATPKLNGRTEFGAKHLEQILGLKDFITKAEEAQLKLQLEENPDYYHFILPFAQVIGVADIWSKRFNEITIRMPAWLNVPPLPFPLGINASVALMASVSPFVIFSVMDPLYHRIASPSFSTANAGIARTGGIVGTSTSSSGSSGGGGRW